MWAAVFTAAGTVQGAELQHVTRGTDKALSFTRGRRVQGRPGARRGTLPVLRSLPSEDPGMPVWGGTAMRLSGKCQSKPQCAIASDLLEWPSSKR